MFAPLTNLFNQAAESLSGAFGLTNATQYNPAGSWQCLGPRCLHVLCWSLLVAGKRHESVRLELGARKDDDPPDERADDIDVLSGRQLLEPIGNAPDYLT